MLIESPKPDILLAHQEAKRKLREQIGRRWLIGAKLPAVGQLSQELGTGRTSIYRAIRELVREGTLASRPKHGTFVVRLVDDDVGNPSPVNPAPFHHRSRQVTSLKDKRVHLSIAGEPEPDRLQQRFADAISQPLLERHVLIQKHIRAAKGSDIYHHTDGDAVVIINPDPSPEIVCARHQLLMVINTCPKSPVTMGGRYDIVTVDHQQGARLAGGRMRAAGLKSACFLGRRPEEDPRHYDQTSAERLAGFERGFGQPVPEPYQLSAKAYCVDFGARAIETYLQLKPRPEALFAASDELAVGFVLGALARGLEPTRDYHIIGFDGQKIGRELAAGPLTTVAVPVAQMGRHAAALLMDRFDQPDQPVRKTLFDCSIYEGATVRPSVIHDALKRPRVQKHATG